MGEPLALEVDGGLGHLIIDDPPGNEMGPDLFVELARLCEEELPGLDVRGLVVEGRGRHFSSGARIPDLVQLLGGEKGEEMVAENHASFGALAELPYPTVAAIRGCCFGVGLELALTCRTRIAAERAVFALPEAEFGLIPGCGGTARLQRLVGPSRAVDLILSGRTLGAEEALEIGLVDRVVPKRDLDAAALCALEAWR